MKAHIWTGVVLATAGLWPATSEANCCLHRSATPVVSYYTPIYYAPIPVVTPAPILIASPIIPVAPASPLPPTPVYAQPTPAPASSPVPPTAPNRVQSLKTSEGEYDIHYVSFSTSDRLPGPRCSVIFWNLTGRDLTLYVDGQAHRLPAQRSLKLNLPHDFSWNKENSLSHRQQVPAQEGGLEVVLRE